MFWLNCLQDLLWRSDVIFAPIILKDLFFSLWTTEETHNQAIVKKTRHVFACLEVWHKLTCCACMMRVWNKRHCAARTFKACLTWCQNCCKKRNIFKSILFHSTPQCPTPWTIDEKRKCREDGCGTQKGGWQHLLVQIFNVVVVGAQKSSFCLSQSAWVPQDKQQISKFFLNDIHASTFFWRCQLLHFRKHKSCVTMTEGLSRLHATAMTTRGCSLSWTISVTFELQHHGLEAWTKPICFGLLVPLNALVDVVS